MSAEPIVEYAVELAGGSMQVWPSEPELEEVYPLAKRIEHGQRRGGRVYTRTIVVIENWSEVPRAAG